MGSVNKHVCSLPRCPALTRSYLPHLVQSKNYVVVSDSLDTVYHPVHVHVHLSPSNLGFGERTGLLLVKTKSVHLQRFAVLR